MPVFLRWLLRLGPTNPVAVRLVQGGSRRRRHMYIRAGYLGVLIVVLLWSLLGRVQSDVVSYRELAAAGAASFTQIAYLQIGLICVLAPVFMAGAIAQEASPQTWDILLTTPLSATQIVLGNLLGRLFFILALLVSTLPLFAVTQYFGGVPGSSIFASYLIAGCAALLVASAAIALSVSRLVGRRAVFAFYVSVVSYLAVTIALDRILGTGGVSSFTALNPFLALRALLDPSGYPRNPDASGLAGAFLAHPVTTWCVLSGVVSLGLIIASTVTVRLGGLAGLARERGSAVPWYRRIFGLGPRGGGQRPGRTVWHNPIAWREAAARNATLGRMIARWSFIAAGGLLALGVVLYYFGGHMPTRTFRQVVVSAAVGELVVIILVTINMAATAVTREREDGTLDLLTTTPLTASAYLTGKLRGMIAYLLPMLAVPTATLGLAGLYVGAARAQIIVHPGGTEIDPAANRLAAYAVNVAARPPVSAMGTPGTIYPVPAVLPEALLVAALTAVPFAAFCVILGLHWSLRSKGSLGAVVGTVGIVGVVAGTVGLCGWQMGGSIPGVGPVIAAATPATAAFALTGAEVALQATIDQSGPGTARFALILGGVLAAAAWAAVVYGVHANMVRTFDMTIRRLAGTK